MFCATRWERVGCRGSVLLACGCHEIPPAACENVVRLDTEGLILTGRFWTQLVYNTLTHHVAN